MFYAFVLVTIGLFAIGSFEGVEADGKIRKQYFSNDSYIILVIVARK